MPDSTPVPKVFEVRNRTVSNFDNAYISDKALPDYTGEQNLPSRDGTARTSARKRPSVSWAQLPITMGSKEGSGGSSSGGGSDDDDSGWGKPHTTESATTNVVYVEETAHTMDGGRVRRSSSTHHTRTTRGRRGSSSSDSELVSLVEEERTRRSSVDDSEKTISCVVVATAALSPLSVLFFIVASCILVVTVTAAGGWNIDTSKDRDYTNEVIAMYSMFTVGIAMGVVPGIIDAWYRRDKYVVGGAAIASAGAAFLAMATGVVVVVFLSIIAANCDEYRVCTRLLDKDDPSTVDGTRPEFYVALAFTCVFTAGMIALTVINAYIARVASDADENTKNERKDREKEARKNSGLDNGSRLFMTAGVITFAVVAVILLSIVSTILVTTITAAGGWYVDDTKDFTTNAVVLYIFFGFALTFGLVPAIIIAFFRSDNDSVLGNGTAAFGCVAGSFGVGILVYLSIIAAACEDYLVCDSNPKDGVQESRPEFWVALAFSITFVVFMFVVCCSSLAWRWSVN